MKKMSSNTTKRNKKRQNQKNGKIFKKMTKKKKTLYAIMLLIHSNANAFLMYEIPNTTIQFKKEKHEKTHPFISFRLAFSFHFER